MIQLRYLLMLPVLASVTSCIEEYNELPDGNAEHMLVIEGQIISESDCIFSLRHSALLSEDAYLSFLPYSGAQVAVQGSNGDIFTGQEVTASEGHYLVRVGKLNPDVSYQLLVSTPEGAYASKPMLPLDAPDITELRFEQPRDDRQVDFYISTSDPQATVYYKWQFRETWEIHTPYMGLWEYIFNSPEQFRLWDPTDKSSPVPSGYFNWLGHGALKNHGWVRQDNQQLIFSSNIDYGQGALQRLCFYQRDPDNNRFQTRYLTQVWQMAISAEEYEYLNLMSTQSSEMGGLFTPMPSELPSNITSPDGRRAIGYIGVRGHVSEAEIYISRQDVGHVDLYHVKLVPDSLVEAPPFMIKKGYYIAEHDPYMGTTSWTNRWAVDCTDPFWGGSLERPDYWREEEED